MHSKIYMVFIFSAISYLVDMSDESDQLSEEAVAEYSDAFNLLDKDRNGMITASELETVMRYLGLNTTETELEGMIKEVDKDGNESVDFREFLVMLTGVQQDDQDSGDIQNDLRDAFQVFDKNNDKYINKKELKQILTALGEQLADQEAEEMITIGDKDGDGRINFKEFTDMFVAKLPRTVV